MAQENEHKYLVRSASWRKQTRGGEHYEQGYLSTDPERSVRVRAGTKTAFLTIKGSASGGNGALNRSEFEYPIPLEDAKQLLEHLCHKPLIEKTRFRVPQNGHVWEIDEFEDRNQGLVLAELELPDGQAPKHLPSWVGPEVSDDSRYSNVHLVEHPFSEWRGRSQEPEAKYHWKAHEGVSKGLQRIVSEQLQLAIWQLSENPPSLDEAVHEARKALKKTRSALRLMKNLLGQSYDKENGVLRAAGQKLSPLRDAQALIEMFDDLNGKYRETLGDRSLVAVRDGLAARKDKLSKSFHRKSVVSTVLKDLRDVHARVEKWRLDKGGLKTISSGFARTIQRNRKAWDDAYASSRPDAFHEWRKRVKDLRYHLDLLGKVWPPVLNGYLDAAKDLEQRLGDDHNLVVLRDTVLEHPADFGKEEDVSCLMKLIDRHQKQLRAEAATLGARLYSDKRDQWRNRLELCWSAWKQDTRREHAAKKATS
ncbi:MAG: CHAD domain-containing protein [Bryobacterales bacterium]|nr:CHAD domain-containing protein [Bryobacterales bacterium]